MTEYARRLNMGGVRVEDAVDTLVEKGFAVINGFVDAPTLELLQRECDLLHVDVDATVSKGCILQPTLPKGEQKTSSLESYLHYRARNTIHMETRLAQTVSTGLWSGSKLKETASLVFGDEAYFYNEQYIVKPPGLANTEFPLHKDCDALPSCPAYVSFWIALDDITRTNGGLTAVPLGSVDKPEELLISKGDAILLAHDVDHKSSPNESTDLRRAYMVQISQLPVYRPNGNLAAFAARFSL